MNTCAKSMKKNGKSIKKRNVIEGRQISINVVFVITHVTLKISCGIIKKESTLKLTVYKPSNQLNNSNVKIVDVATTTQTLFVFINKDASIRMRLKSNQN